MTVPQKVWDPSTIGVNADDMAEMDEDERKERAADEINRAADILQAVVVAFRESMTSEQRAEVSEAAEMAIRVARGIE